MHAVTLCIPHSMFISHDLISKFLFLMYKFKKKKKNMLQSVMGQIDPMVPDKTFKKKNYNGDIKQCFSHKSASWKQWL